MNLVKEENSNFCKCHLSLWNEKLPCQKEMSFQMHEQIYIDTYPPTFGN